MRYGSERELTLFLRDRKVGELRPGDLQEWQVLPARLSAHQTMINGHALSSPHIPAVGLHRLGRVRTSQVCQVRRQRLHDRRLPCRLNRRTHLLRLYASDSPGTK